MGKVIAHYSNCPRMQLSVETCRCTAAAELQRLINDYGYLHDKFHELNDEIGTGHNATCVKDCYYGAALTPFREQEEK